MSLLGNRLRADAGNPPPADPVDARWWNANGVAPISPDKAQMISTVWACVRVISETVASMPLFVYERLPEGGKERASDHPVYDLVHFRPNSFQTIFEFIEMLTAHAVLRGNGYAEIIPGRRGFVDQLIPLHPDRVVPEWNAKRDAIVYRVVDEAKQTQRILLQDEVVHLRGRSENGLAGMSVVYQARRALGLTEATETHGIQLFNNGANPGIMLEHPGELSGGAAQRLAAQFDSRHAGAENAGRTMVLEEGLKASRIGLSSDDAQFLETRQFQVAEICRWFRVPPHKVHDLSRATFSNIEHQSLEFVIDTILPWARRWELALSADLIAVPQKYFIEFLMDGLLRGDSAARVAYYTGMSELGAMNPDEIRDKEGMNPLPNGQGKTYRVPGAAAAPAGDTAGATLYQRNGNGTREAVPHG